MQTMKTDAAILLMSCDAYSDLWDDFYQLKEKNWPDCRFVTYHVTEDKECAFPNVITIKCGTGTQWTERLRHALITIDTEYVILMLEDFYISQKIRAEQIDQALELMQKDHISYYKLDERWRIKGKPYDGRQYLIRLEKNYRYGISLLTSIWNKQFLLRTIGEENYSAWEFELRRNRDDDITKTDPSLVCVYDSRNIMHIKHMVERGKYLKRSVIQLKRDGYLIENMQRPCIGYFRCLITRASEIIRSYEWIRRILIGIMHAFGQKTVSEKYAEKYKQ